MWVPGKWVPGGIPELCQPPFPSDGAAQRARSRAMWHAQRVQSRMRNILRSFGRIGVVPHHATAHAPRAPLRDTHVRCKVGTQAHVHLPTKGARQVDVPPPSRLKHEKLLSLMYGHSSVVHGGKSKGSRRLSDKHTHQNTHIVHDVSISRFSQFSPSCPLTKILQNVPNIVKVVFLARQTWTTWGKIICEHASINHFARPN